MDSWVTQRVTLSYQLSDFTLARIAVPMHNAQFGLKNPVAESADPQPPAVELAAGSWGSMLRGLPVAGELPALHRVGGFIRYVPSQYRHFFIDMSAGGFDAYRQKFSSKTRSTIVRKVKRYTEHCGGQLRWTAYRTPAEIEAFFPIAAALSAKTYQERLLDAGLPTGTAYVKQMLAEAAHDRVRAWLLFDGERPVSYLFCPIEDGIVVYAHLGYDPDYSKLSVGTVLQWLALEQLFDERRYRYFDFTEGESEHKRLFATHEQRRANVMFVRDHLRGRLLVFSHRAVTGLSESLGRLLQRWGLKARIKRLLRFGLLRRPEAAT